MHSLQSSLAYSLYVNALLLPSKTKVEPDITALKQRLKEDDSVIFQKFGAYSQHPKETKISQIAKSGISSFRDSLILKSLINYSESTNVLELGASVGLNAIVLAKGADISITSVDIDTNLVEIARENAIGLDLEDSISFVNEDIDEFLNQTQKQEIKYDFVYVDANHTYDATIRYFNKLKTMINPTAIVVFDDINWSRSMHKAWRAIKADINKGLIIENFNMGIWIKNSNSVTSYILEF